MVYKVPEEESRAGGRDLLHDQVSKLSGQFSLLANAEYTPKFFGSFRKVPNFRKLPKISEPSENFGTFRNFVNAFRNAGTRTTSLLEHSTNNHDKKTSVSYIICGMGQKSLLVVKIFRNFRKSRTS